MRIFSDTHFYIYIIIKFFQKPRHFVVIFFAECYNKNVLLNAKICAEK